MRSTQPKPLSRTKPEMRIAIAQDVLAMLETSRIRAMPGVYLHSDRKVSEKDIEDDVQLSDRLKKCEVCALGAMFVADVVLNDKLGFKELEYTGELYSGDRLTISRSLIQERLEPYFTRDVLYLIEDIFESCDKDWTKMYPQAKKRLEAIMRNIIRHAGTFKPEKEAAFFEYEKARAKG